jgi:hypothetical protein
MRRQTQSSRAWPTAPGCLPQVLLAKPYQASVYIAVVGAIMRDSGWLVWEHSSPCEGYPEQAVTGGGWGLACGPAPCTFPPKHSALPACNRLNTTHPLVWTRTSRPNQTERDLLTVGGKNFTPTAAFSESRTERGVSAMIERCE